MTMFVGSVRARCAGFGMGLAVLAGCSQAPPLRYFVLTPVPSGEAPAATGAALTIGVQPVDLADYLDRPEIVTRTGPAAIALSSVDRWGEPLDMLTGRVLVQNLNRLLPGKEVFLLPTSFILTPDREIVVEIDRFDADETGAVRLDARWQLSNPANGRVIAERRTSLSEPIAPAPNDTPAATPVSLSAGGAGSPSYQPIAVAMSRALTTMSREMAAAVK